MATNADNRQQVSAAERQTCAILVPQADSLGAVAVVRSLGQHGYQVHAASAKPGALGCLSAFASFHYQCPAYEDPAYLSWLRALINSADIRAIIPSEGFLLAVRDCFAEFSPLMAIPQDAELVYGCLSKVFVFNQFLQSSDAQLHAHISRTAVLDNNTDFDAVDFTGWRLPYFVKGDGYYARSGDQALVRKVGQAQDARQAVNDAFAHYHKVLLQDCSQGVKATVNLLMQDGQILAESMAVASHENPHTGGLTSLRESWWFEPMYQDAVHRLKALQWNGPAMVEYKWHQQSQTFDFIELNSRYWAALNLDIHAGIHFPAVQMDYFLFGVKPAQPLRLTTKIRVRHAFPADFGYLLSKLKDPQVAAYRKLKSLLGFFLYFLHPAIKSDLNYPGDRRLALLNTKSFLMELAQSCLKKLS
ncbi:hypothetical protein [Rheinheimera sp.]|uniref:hypothetical protein n=1 Tax=Rheinheimera sp. TaxID=1869214 RepID=UPI003D273EB4